MCHGGQAAPEGGQGASGPLWWEVRERGTEVKEKEEEPHSRFHSLLCAGTEAPTLPRAPQVTHLNRFNGVLAHQQ